MKILRKIISIFILVTLLINSFGISYANNTNLHKDLIFTKKELEETKQGEKYIDIIDNLIEENKNNEIKLKEIKKDTEEVIEKLKNNNLKLYQNIKLILNYLEIKTAIAIQDIGNEKLIPNISIDDLENEISNLNVNSDGNKEIEIKEIDIEPPNIDGINTLLPKPEYGINTPTTITIDDNNTLNNGNEIYCTMEYAPVCGTDGKTYSNRCECQKRGVNILYNGVCNETNTNKLVIPKQKKDILEEIEEKSLLLSEEDKTKVNGKLVKIQLELLNKGIEGIEGFISEFEKLLNYEEKGNFEMSLNLDEENIGKIDVNLKILDYITKTSNFDSQFKGTISAIINSAITNPLLQNKDETSLELDSVIDLISKNGDIYLLLEKFNLKKENIDFISKQIEEFEKIAKQKKYIKYTNDDIKGQLDIIRNLNPKNILSDGKRMLSKPMFRAYEKKDNKYYIIPTKYACDELKNFMNKFDPFNGKKCSKGQYKDMLKEFVNIGNFYIELGDSSTKLGFESNDTDPGIKKIQLYLILSDNEEIEEVKIEIIPNQTMFPNEGLILDYIKNKKLDFSFYANKGYMDYKFISKINNNKFTYIDFSGITKSLYSNISSKLKLENGKIDGEILGKYKESIGTPYEDNINIKVKISGSTNPSDSSISNLKIDLVGNDIKEQKEFLTSVFTYSNGIFALKNNFINEATIIDSKISGTRNSLNKILTRGEFNLDIKAKKGELNYDTYKYDYSGEYKDIFNSKINFKDKKINGETTLYGINDYSGKKLISIEHLGNLEKNYFVLNNKFIIDENPFGKNYETKKVLEKIEGAKCYRDYLEKEKWNCLIKNKNINSMDGNFNINFDLRDNRNNGSIYFDASVQSKKIIDFKLKNEGTIDYNKKVEIKKPNDSEVINFNEIK